MSRDFLSCDPWPLKLWNIHVPRLSIDDSTIHVISLSATDFTGLADR
jgi:hypothetical protein